MYLKDLSPGQDENISYLLNFANTAELDALQEIYPENIVKKRKIELYRNNLMVAIMGNIIPIEDLKHWIDTIKLNSNNTIVHFEFDSQFISEVFSEKFIEVFRKKQINILEVNRNEFTKMSLHMITQVEDQLLLGFSFPATKLNENYIFEDPNEWLEKSFFFSYAWFDKADSSLTFSIPNTSGYKSIEQEISSRKFVPHVINLLKQFIQSNLESKIKFNSSEWVNHALRTITLEYYSHNDTRILEDLSNLKNKLEKKTNGTPEKIDQENIIEQICSINDSLKNEITKKRIVKSILSSIEKELLNSYQIKITQQHVFEVFLQEVDKGLTTFKTKSGKTDQPLLHMYDTRDIILSMLEKATIKSIGLRYKDIPYKITCANDYFILEPDTTKNINKELTRDVLRQFKIYKQKLKNGSLSKNL